MGFPVPCLAGDALDQRFQPLLLQQRHVLVFIFCVPGALRDLFHDGVEPIDQLMLLAPARLGLDRGDAMHGLDHHFIVVEQGSHVAVIVHELDRQEPVFIQVLAEQAADGPAGFERV